MSALAQNKVSGTVVSADDGEPIIGASIRLVGTNFGAVTDVNPSPKVEGIIEILGSCLLQRAFSIGDNL